MVLKRVDWIFRHPVFHLCVCVVLAIVLRLPWIYADILDWDEGAFLIVSAKLLHGFLPYVPFWENKPPLGFFVYGTWFKLFSPSLLSLRFFSAVVVGVSAYLMGRLWQRVDQTAGVFPVAILFILLATFYGWGMTVLVDQLVFPVLLVLMGLLISANLGRRQLFSGGLLLGIMVLLRSQLIVIVPVMLFFLLRRSSLRPTRSFQLIVFGGLLPIILVSGIYFINASFEALFRGAVLAGMVRVNDFSFAVALDGFMELIRYACRWPSGVFSGLAVIGVGVSFLPKMKDKRMITQPFLLTFLALMFSVFILSTGFRHYLDLWVPFILFFSLLTVSELRRFLPTLKWLIPNVLIVLFSMQIARDFQSFYGFLKAEDNRTLIHRISDDIEEAGFNGESAYILSIYHSLYHMNQLKMLSSVAHPSGIFNEGYLTALEGRTWTTGNELDRIFTRKPTLVIIDEWAFRHHVRPPFTDLFRKYFEHYYDIVNVYMDYQRHSQVMVLRRKVK